MKNILIVEDDLFLRDLTSKQLTQFGFNTIAARTTDEAASMLQSTHIDLIVLDLDLPSQSGGDYLRELKADPTQKHIPVIVFSNDDKPETASTCIADGADSFFVKISTDISELKQRIDTLLQ